MRLMRPEAIYHFRALARTLIKWVTPHHSHVALLKKQWNHGRHPSKNERHVTSGVQLSQLSER